MAAFSWPCCLYVFAEVACLATSFATSSSLLLQPANSTDRHRSKVRDSLFMGSSQYVIIYGAAPMLTVTQDLKKKNSPSHQKHFRHIFDSQTLNHAPHFHKKLYPPCFWKHQNSDPAAAS